MAIFGALFAAVGRVFGRIANMALSWASVLLFGQVPQSKQMLLTFVTLGSLAWIAALVGVAVPSVGTVLLAAVPRPSFVSEDLVRIVMLVIAIVLPIVIGIGTIFLLDRDRRPKRSGLVVQALRGYPYAAVLAITLVFLAVIALVRKARSLVKRWQDAHIALVVKPGRYDVVAADVEEALDDAGLDVTRERAPRVLEVPAKLLGAVGGPGVKGLVPDRLVQLKANGLEILLHPSDIAFLGEKALLAHARAAIATRLTHTEAYLTSSAEAQQVEERITALARKDRVTADDFRPIDDTLASLVVPADEWDTLYRMRLQVENEKRLPDASRPALPDTGNARAAQGDRGTPEPTEPTGLGWAAAIASLGLLAADVVLAILETIRGDGRARRRT